MMTDVAFALAAKGNELPALIGFPASLALAARPVMMLGLGDIVIPGLAVMIGFREARRHGRAMLAAGPWIGWLVGLAVTVAVMCATGKPQPATLYLVPTTLGGLILASWRTGLRKEIWQPTPSAASGSDDPPSSSPRP
jgi:signal peptide peptidase-like protein 3